MVRTGAETMKQTTRPKTQKTISCVLYDVRAEAEERAEHRANNTAYNKAIVLLL